jgi:hypothetical protein
MSKSRKTVDLQKMIDYANGYLSADTNDLTGPARRQGVIDMLEAALFTANRYAGFRYLDERDLSASTPGIRLKDGNMPSFVNTDPTRRAYY